MRGPLNSQTVFSEQLEFTLLTPNFLSSHSSDRSHSSLSTEKLCALRVVSPRDRWSCVLPRWQFNVNVNVSTENGGETRL